MSEWVSEWVSQSVSRLVSQSVSQLAVSRKRFPYLMNQNGQIFVAHVWRNWRDSTALAMYTAISIKVVG